MNDLSSYLEAAKGYGGYTTSVILLVGGLLSWWKVLPSLIDAISNRQSKIEERMGKLLDDATERFDRQIKAADDRHAECMEGQKRLQDRVTALENEIDKLRDENAGLKKQRISAQVSAIRSAPDSISSPVIEDMVQSLEKKGFGA